MYHFVYYGTVHIYHSSFILFSLPFKMVAVFVYWDDDDDDDDDDEWICRARHK